MTADEADDNLFELTGLIQYLRPLNIVQAAVVHILGHEGQTVDIWTLCQRVQQVQRCAHVAEAAEQNGVILFDLIDRCVDIYNFVFHSFRGGRTGPIPFCDIRRSSRKRGPAGIDDRAREMKRDR